MTRYALRRLAGIVPTLFVIVTAAFCLMRLAPGGPVHEEQPVPPEIEANLQAAYGLDQPVLVQYRNYVAGLLHGDLGPSFRIKDYGVAELSHLNLYDRTVEGLVLKDVPGCTVQYHPEAGPGPHDARYLFDRFLELVK